MEPETYEWLVPGALAVAERPGGGGRAHRIARRVGELQWWWDQGIRTIVSAKPTRHGLVDYGLAGFRYRWHPLVDGEEAPDTLLMLVEDVARLMRDPASGGVLVHCDRPEEWLSAIDAALRLRLGLAAAGPAALADVERGGLPVGSIAVRLVSALENRLRTTAVPA